MSNGISDLREFGRFRLDLGKKVLWCEEKPVALPLKSIELLSLLVERKGEVVTKDEIWHTVWQDSFVEETNLTHNIYLLRKMLKDLGEVNLIQTVPRRGYRFAGEVSEIEAGEIVIEKHTHSKTLIEIEEQRAKQSVFSHRYFVLFSLILLIGLLGGFGFFYYQSSSAENSAFKIKSIVVLPLKPITATSNDSDNVLSLGLADSLITKLAASQKLVVLPTSSIIRFDEKKTDALEIGRKMQVDAILDGSFQRLENRLRVSVRLIRVVDGKQIWSGNFDETENDIFKLQDEISNQAAASLALNLNQQERELVLKRYTENVEAYQAYLRGRYLYFHTNDEPKIFERAIVEFEQALKLDPDYALAFSGLADAYSRKANISHGAERGELYEKAKENALKALDLDENLAEAHEAIGWINRIYDWNWTESEKHFKRAVELAPNDARYYHLYSFLLVTLGRTTEAVENARRAKELDPVSKSSVYAFVLSCDRKFDEAITENNKILGKSPDSTVWRNLISEYLSNGQPAEALRVYNLAPPERQEDFSMRVLLPIAFYFLGETVKSEEILHRLEQEAKPEDAVQLAAVYSTTGRNEEAISALQKALQIRADRLMWLKTNQHFDNIRNDLRFQEILRKMNLE